MKYLGWTVAAVVAALGAGSAAKAQEAQASF
jgi:hypothetical protein